MKGTGSQQDYGMRIYDPRLGRFLSVDPITKDYPELTPYQFASNRPIDGIDLDGEEYYRIHVKIYVDQSGKAHRSLQKIVSFRDTEKGFGKKGKGIEYIYQHVRHYENSPKTYSFEADRFIQNYHGIYVGPDNPTKDWKNSNSKGKYAPEYSFKPMDVLDAAARKHDIAYDLVSASGIQGALFNLRTLQADIDLVQRANGVIDMFHNKEMDPYTNKVVSEETYNYAIKVRNAFTGIANNKVDMESGFMMNEQESKKAQSVKSELKKSRKD